MEPYPCDPYCAALIFMAAMSGVMPLGTAVNHRTKIFPANMYVAAAAATGTTKSSQLDELVDFPLRLVRAKVANRNAQELEAYLALPKGKRPPKPPTPLLCDTGDATPEALIASRSVSANTTNLCCISRTKPASISEAWPWI